MSNVEVSYMREDLRPAIVLDHIDGADFQHVRPQKAEDIPMFMLNAVKNF